MPSTGWPQTPAFAAGQGQPLRRDQHARRARPKGRTVTPGERWLDPEIASVVPFLPDRPAGSTTIAEGRKMLEEMLGAGAPAAGEEQLTSPIARSRPGGCS